VIFRDGSTEAHVPANRIAIPASRLHAQNSNLYTPAASGKYSKSSSTNNLSSDSAIFERVRSFPNRTINLPTEVIVAERNE
jgi:hypothetical protein